jgi:hypothetical protein
MSSRKDELLAKKAKLAELKRQRELREEQRTTGPRHSIGGQVRTGNIPALNVILTLCCRRALRGNLLKSGDQR